MHKVNGYKPIGMNGLINFSILILLLISGFNFFEQFKVASVPLFQSLLIVIVIVLLFLSKRVSLPDLVAIKYYNYYLLTSLVSMVIGYYFHHSSVLTYLYGLLPLLLFMFTYKKINHDYYEKMIITLGVSMFLVTTIGWLIRIELIEYQVFFRHVIESEYRLGYWGIRYLESTRNADYLYPLVGLSISMYFYLKRARKYQILLMIFYISTLFASFSRAAILIAIFSIIFVIINIKVKHKFIFFLVFLTVITINFDYLSHEFDQVYRSILDSIFVFENTARGFSNDSRISIFQFIWEPVLWNPIGYGIDNYAFIYQIFGHTDNMSNSAENAFLTILIERGWAAFLLFSISFFMMLLSAHKNKDISLNKALLPLLLIYFMFNYELNNVFSNFIFYIIFVDHYLSSRSREHE